VLIKGLVFCVGGSHLLLNSCFCWSPSRRARVRRGRGSCDTPREGRYRHVYWSTKDTYTHKWRKQTSKTI